MRFCIQRLVIIPAIFLTLFVLLLAPAQARPLITNNTSAKQAILRDYDTGMVLFEKNADEHMPTSSMSKAMTIFMVFEALRDQRIGLKDTFKVSEKAWRKRGSKMFVEVGKRVTIEDLIRGVIVQSGNDATIVLAEGLAGSEDVFAEAMTLRAKEIGMKNSNFVNASGWPDPDHYSTARDLSILAINLIKKYPEYYPYFAETEFTFNNITQRNRNPVLYKDIGADGLKTGHTVDGGYGLMVSGKFGKRRVVLVVNGLEDEKSRAQESSRLLEWGLKGFQNLVLFKVGETVDYAYVVMGKAEQVPLMIEQDLTVTIPKTVRNDLTVEVVFKGPLEAPVKRGQRVGTLHVDVPRVTKITIPLFAAGDVERLGFMAGTLAKAKLFIKAGVAGE